MKTAIIIGASTGIGRCTALKLAKSYDNISITSFKHTEELNSLKNEIEAQGAHCFAMTGDAGDFNFIKEFISETTKLFGKKIDLLINNAAISYVGLLTDMSIDDWNKTISTNITSIFNSCNQVVPYMVRERAGKIINISSVWGNVGASCEVAYSASKGAVNSFTKALAKELAPNGISVNAIAFGAIDTAMNSHLSDEEKELLADEIPAGYIASPETAADFIIKISTADSYLTGQVLNFDGAWQ